MAIIAEDPKAILDPVKMAEEEAAAAAKAAGVATAPTAASDEAADEAAVAVPTTGRRRLGGGGAAGPRASRVGFTTGVVTDNAPGGQLELEHLTGRWFTPDELICVLTASGVNIFPRPDSGTRVECIEKVNFYCSWPVILNCTHTQNRLAHGPKDALEDESSGSR